MGVVLLVNPKSGRGIGVRLADRFERVLRAEGWGTTRLAAFRGVDAEAGTPFVPERFAGADALAVIGGDGTLSRVTAVASATGTPVYHVPVGNENLFARQFGMTRDPEALAVALQRRDVVATDLADMDLNGSTFRFLVMASTGPDAGVVRRLDEKRTKAIGHLAYAGPVIAELARPMIPRLTVDVDGERIVDGRTGWLVVANARPYGGGVDIARHASFFSGLLDVVFMPCRSSAEAAWWMTRARVAWHLRDRRLVYRAGSRVRVTSESGGGVWQYDGEAAGNGNGEGDGVGIGQGSGALTAGHACEFVVRPRVLPVLRP